MILLFVIGLFVPHSDAHFTNSPASHASEALKVKCDALPYRSAKVEYGCYFAVMKKIEYRKAADQCSSILYGAKVTTKVPAAIFDAMMIDKSAFHLDSESTGAMHTICVYEDEYKCDVGSSMLTSGRCIVRAAKKMNFVDAESYCADMGFTIPAPANELDNRIVRDALVRDPAWVRKSVVRESGFKWTQGKTFTKWTTCDRPDQNPRLYAGSQNSLWNCASDTASVIDRLGYWSNGGTENMMEVICMKDANNAFIDGEKQCKSYHEEDGSGQKSGKQPPLAVATDAKTCYTAVRTTTRYEVVGRATVETQRGCEVRCDAKSECTGFAFKDAGFSSSCVLLSTPISDKTCTGQTTILVKKTTGCAARTDITTDFGVDPCVDEIVPSAFQGLTPRGLYDPICRRHSLSETDANRTKDYIIRAIDAEGRRITLDNENANKLRRSGDMWEYVYVWTGFYSYTKKIVSIACATAGSEKCPCAPLKHLTEITKPNYPANPDNDPACPAKYFYFVPTKCETCRPVYMGRSDQHNIVKCKAGMWHVFRSSDNNNWGVTGIACY